MAHLFLRRRTRTSELVRDSYDQIAGGYDEAWTGHMRDLSSEMLDRLAPLAGANCIDLTCGTGFLTAQLAGRTGTMPVGVDASEGMLAVARKQYGQKCDFVCSDVLEYLCRLPACSVDVITCGWGLGYSRPAAVIRQISRVLRPGGGVGIIDNSLLSLADVLFSAMLTFAECPNELCHVMDVRFLPHSCVLACLMRCSGLGVRASWDGRRTYHVPDGRTAVDRLTSTGAAAGFEFAVEPENHEEIFARFAEIIEERSADSGSVCITHRYLAAVGVKQC